MELRYGLGESASNDHFVLRGKLQVATAAEALSVLPGNRKKIIKLRILSSYSAEEHPKKSEGIEPQIVRLTIQQGLDLRIDIIRGLESQLLDSNLPPEKRIAAHALWEIMAESLLTTPQS